MVVAGHRYMDMIMIVLHLYRIPDMDFLIHT